MHQIMDEETDALGWRRMRGATDQEEDSPVREQGGNMPGCGHGGEYAGREVDAPGHVPGGRNGEMWMRRRMGQRWMGRRDTC